jgi:hypothetical protein
MLFQRADCMPAVAACEASSKPLVSPLILAENSRPVRTASSAGVKPSDTTLGLGAGEPPPYQGQHEADFSHCIKGLLTRNHTSPVATTRARGTPTVSTSAQPSILA